MNVGKFYEGLAVSFLKWKGYKIIERNFHSIYGEIDIIAEDLSLVFIEVRARKEGALVSGIQSVDKQKIEKIKRTAQFYISGKQDRYYRFDFLEITQGNLWRQYNLIKAAFDMDD
ncbi:MAG: YraN family protein [Candidatus Omnitrophica bacterium]|nr:YraN family protein [Candidatus Omnitrophota bacterium]